jgi:hypothetical protein
MFVSARQAKHCLGCSPALIGASSFVELAIVRACPPAKCHRFRRVWQTGVMLPQNAPHDVLVDLDA